MRIGVIGWREGESRLYMRVGLAPVLALLGEAAASDSPDMTPAAAASLFLGSPPVGKILGVGLFAIAQMMCLGEE